MHTPSKLALISVSLVSSSCIQQSFNQLSISDSQTNDTTNASSSTTNSVTSGGAFQTGGASGSTTTTLSVTSDAGTSMQVEESDTDLTGSSTSDPDTDATSTSSTTGQEECAAVVNGTCYSSDQVRLVFVTGKTYTGAMMGDPDALCNEAAANLPGAGEYKAWATTTKGPPAMRLDTTFDGPYVKLNSKKDPDLQFDEFVPVAMGWKGLTSSELLSGIDTTEARETTKGYAWTGAINDGSANEKIFNCGNWLNSNSLELKELCEPFRTNYGHIGIIGEKSSRWSHKPDGKCSLGETCCADSIPHSDSEIFECDSSHHIYCIRDE
jgi:hypothetical protein